MARGAHGAFEHGEHMYIFGGICDDEVHSSMCAPASCPETCSCRVLKELHASQGINLVGHFVRCSSEISSLC